MVKTTELKSFAAHRITDRLILIAILPLVGCSSALLPDPNVRFIAFGDSATDGPSGVRPYWDILRETLNEPPETFGEQGKGGETSAEGLTRLNDLFTRQVYPNAQSLMYWQGGDDLVEFIRNRDPLLLLSPDNASYPYAGPLNQKLTEVQANIEQAIASAHDAGLKVLVATYYFLEENKDCKSLPFGILLAFQAQNANAYVTRLNARIRQAAMNQNAILVDIETIGNTLRQDPDNYFDCNHLSTLGNELVADQFAAALAAP